MENLKAVVLAAGKGTRLQKEGSNLPKVMREALGKPLLYYVLEAINFIQPEDITIVVGYKKEKITEYFTGFKFAVQSEQLGTGHAVMAAKDQLSDDTAVLVCCGDMPLIKRETYSDLVKNHFEQGNTCTILTGTSDLNLPYGRIIRDSEGAFLEVIEEKDCNEEQIKIRELNSGVYVFKSSELLPTLSELKSDNAQGEYYLTDVPAILKSKKAKIGICMRELGYEIIGVNTLEQLKQVESILNDDY